MNPQGSALWRCDIARNCGCSDAGCQCKVSAGEGISVTGSGTASDPFVITAEITTFVAAFLTQDTPTVNMNLVGSGTVSDPFVLSASSALAMTQLSDWNDPGGLIVGDVPVWQGDHWEGAVPIPVPPGSVNATGGITGDGTVSTPLRVNVSDTTTTTTSGLGIYVDTAGKLRAVAPASTSLDWDDITDKPTSFPTTWSDVSAKPTSFPTTWSLVAGRPTISTSAPSGGSSGDIWYRYV